ncbi:MAG TPA: TolC family protein [Planctomycetota bacterium]|nr:TolC family protein [Planctomycetota bacterium]
MHKTRRAARRMTAVLALLLVASAAAAQDTDTGKREDRAIEDITALDVDTTPRRAIALSMADAIRLTLENNLDIKIRGIDPQTSAADIQKAESRFDWTFETSWSKTRSKTPSSSALSGAAAVMSDSDRISLGLKKTLVTGGTVEPTVTWRRDLTNSTFATINPSYTTDAYVTITQPLLRNAGCEVNKSEIYTARNNTEISKYSFKTNVINTLTQMQQTYWDLVFAIEDLSVKKKSLRLTKDTLEQTRAQVEAGILAPIEVTRVRADVASKEEAILNAQRTVEDREDQLRRFVNKRSSNLRENIGVIPLERGSYSALELDVMREIDEGLRYRPDYLASKISLRNRDIDLVVAKNAKLPVVDIATTLSMNGLGGNTGDSFDLLRTNDFHDWSASVTVEIPLGNRSARADYLKARLAKRQAVYELDNLQQEVIIDVKREARQVMTNLKRIRSTRLARELAEERLKAEEEKFKVGEAVILDVLEAQTLLAEAESNERRAIVDYNKSRIALEAAKGTLLERNRVLLTEDLKPSPMTD